MASNGDAAPPLVGELLAHYQKIEERLLALDSRLDRTEMNVLVFGVGKSGPKALYRKRLQIQAELNKIPGVTAILPEDKEYRAAIRARYRLPDQDPVAIELVQAELADVVIALEPGPGVQDEVTMCALRRSLASKVFDLQPEEWRATAHTSFSGAIRDRVLKQYYSPSDLEECHVATTLCPEHVRRERVMKVLR